jgi:hypothetical protein
MAFGSVKSIVDSKEIGKETVFSFRKVPSQTTSTGIWIDTTISPGNPSPFYYASEPLVGAPVDASRGGIRHGNAPAPAKKYLKDFSFMAASFASGVGYFMLCDILFYYPFIAEDTNDVQELVNTVSLPRYANGNGVKIMPVTVAQHATGNIPFVVTYTNQNGVGGRVTPPHTLTSASFFTGIISTSNATETGGLASTANPFMALQSGDSGVRSIQSIQFTSGSDVGLITLVLVKPLASFSFRSAAAPCETDYLTDRGFAMPTIDNNAFLSLIGTANVSFAGQNLQGTIETVWG